MDSLEEELAEYSVFSPHHKAYTKTLNAINELMHSNPSVGKVASLYHDMAENLRALRNNCSQGFSHQIYIVALPEALDILSLAWRNDHEIFEVLNYEQSSTIKLIIWQLTANLCVNNMNTQTVLWATFGEEIAKCYKQDISQFTDTQVMLLNTIHKTKAGILTPTEIFQLLLNVWEKYIERGDDTIDMQFLHILFEELLVKTSRITPIYGPLEAEYRILALKYMIIYIRNGNPNGLIHRNLMEYLAKEFKKKSDCILKENASPLNELHTKEVMALLQVLASASGDERYAPIFSTDHSLFLNVGGLLQMLNELGRNSQNMFTPMEKLVEVAPNSPLNADYQHEFSYELRSMLVRTLANLLYKNRQNQEYAREMNIIKAIFECTRVDARNPLIKEWSILAIRNLCENCPENQELVAQLSRISDADHDIINELNLNMGSLRIRPDN